MNTFESLISWYEEEGDEGYFMVDYPQECMEFFGIVFDEYVKKQEPV
jgi:hypothetical protein